VIQPFPCERAEWCTLDTIKPEAMGIGEGYIIEKAERPRSDEDGCCTIHPSAPEAVLENPSSFKTVGKK
jgi:hypothetical protein